MRDQHVTDTESARPTLAAFRGAVACGRTAHALILGGCAADSTDDRLILTFISSPVPDIPGPLTDVTVRGIGEHRYCISSASREFVLEASSVHLHRDIGRTFYRAIPPRPVPLAKRLFWGLVLRLAGSDTGKRVLAALRRGREA